MTTRSRFFTGFAVILAVLIASYWYWSPILAVHQLQRAAESRDADAVNEKIDYPALRESMKGQFSARLSSAMGQQQAKGNPFAAFGTMIGTAMVNQMIDALVRPETIMYAMSTGQVNPAAPAAQPPVAASAEASSKQQNIRWKYERKGVDRLIAYPRKADQPESETTVGFVFQRTGFVDWKLTEIRLPSEK